MAKKKKKAARKKKTARKKQAPAKKKGAPVEPADVSQRFARVTAPRELSDPEKRASWGLPTTEYERGPYIIELNLQHTGGLPEAENQFLQLHAEATAACQKEAEQAYRDATKGMKAKAKPQWSWEKAPTPYRISKSYYRCELSVVEWRKLIVMDEAKASERGETVSCRAIYRIWPDFPVQAQMDRSVATIKADAAQRAFAAAGVGITWAVIDSGVDQGHPHFGSGGSHALLDPAVAGLHRCFASYREKKGSLFIVQSPPRDPDLDPTLGHDEREKLIEEHKKLALTDEFGHGSHVAGVIAGRAPPDSDQIVALEREFKMDAEGNSFKATFRRRKITSPERFSGVAPNCRLVSLRVLDHEGNGRASNVIQALQYIRERLNDDPKLLRVHGVNLSVGYEFDAEMFACGQSPLCTEVDRLVQAGVVVVAAAGNTGYGTVGAQVRATKVGLSNTINDPGNAALAITVGATHRDAPHTYGVSYFSSKGPTGDGRLKPDLVAPGERITSCAAGSKLATAKANLKNGAVSGEAGQGPLAWYLDDSGTSMAAPHVSGAIAAFLSIRREFIGKPLEVKRIFLDNATNLGRERYFQGHGLVDLMRAIQAV